MSTQDGSTDLQDGAPGGSGDAVGGRTGLGEGDGQGRGSGADLAGRPGLDVEVRVAWLLPPMRWVQAGAIRVPEFPAEESAPIVDYRGPAGAAAAVLRAVADQLDPPRMPSLAQAAAEAWEAGRLLYPTGIDQPPPRAEEDTSTLVVRIADDYENRMRGCPVMIWDGPYKMRCAMGGDGYKCARHGQFERARRCTVEPGCRWPQGHGGTCNPPPAGGDHDAAAEALTHLWDELEQIAFDQMRAHLHPCRASCGEPGRRHFRASRPATVAFTGVDAPVRLPAGDWALCSAHTADLLLASDLDGVPLVAHWRLGQSDDDPTSRAAIVRHAIAAGYVHLRPQDVTEIRRALSSGGA